MGVLFIKNNEIHELIHRADSLLESGQLTNARELYRQVAKIQPDNMDARYMLAVISAESGESAQAERDLRAVLAINQSHADAHLLLADLLAKQNRLSDALVHAEHAVQHDAEYPEAWLLRGMLQARNSDLDEALSSLRRATELSPDSAQAHLNLGNVLRSLGRTPEATVAFELAIGLQPDNLDARLGLAQVYLAKGDLREATASVDAALSVDSENATAWLIRGLAYAQQRDINQARECFRKAIERKPDYHEAWLNLGSACLGLADASGADEAFRRALRLNPDQPEALAGLADALNCIGRHEEALAAAEKGYSSRSGDAYIRLVYACALAGVGRDTEAEDHFRALLQQNPYLVPAHVNLAQICLRRGLIEAAVMHQRAALRSDPGNPRLLCKLALGLQLQGNLDEAMTACDAALALALAPGLPEAVNRQAAILERKGMFGIAISKLEPLLKRECVDAGTALTFARLTPHEGRITEGIELLETLLASGKEPVMTQDKIHKALTTLYDRNGEYQRAFEHSANSHALRNTQFDPDAHDTQVSAIIASLDAVALRHITSHGDPSDRPVFIVGMPRSGTSLVEQILASHPEVFGGGELSDIPEIAASLAELTSSGSHYPTRLPMASKTQIGIHARRYLQRLAQMNADAARFTDKLPHNFLYLGVIQALFPHTHIIHIRRNPLDTCISCYLQDFSSGHSYAYDLVHLGRYYRAYVRLMEHWRRTLKIPFIEIDYEDLVLDLERTSRLLIEFCGLSWNDRCLRFHETRRTVTTPSYNQVRRPLYRTSMQRWRNYEPWIGPLRDALGEPTKYQYL